MNIDLQGKTALVCGASKGIGKSIAIELANSGANVILIARTLKDLMSVHQELNNPDKHVYISADLQTPSEALKIIQSQLPKFNCVDILVNNSGGPPSGKLIKSVPDDMQSAMERHLFASHLLVQEFSQYMKERNWGRIINIISISVKQPIENLGVSNTVRGAVASWAKTLATELAPSGITVNNILPGFTATERLQYLIENTAKLNGISTYEVEQEIIKQIPIGRLAKPEEIAHLAVFLASDYASYITGVSIPIDGGFLKGL
jgi:3-oxoacyl-[acyl-carrier protein] reductase